MALELLKISDECIYQNTLLRFIKKQIMISRQFISHQKQLCLLKLITVLKALNAGLGRPSLNHKHLLILKIVNGAMSSKVTSEAVIKNTPPTTLSPTRSVCLSK